MSNRFHNKFHRHNHHTNPRYDEKDAGDDYIGNSALPFKGDFHLTKDLSAHSLSANFIHTDYLSAYSAQINLLDLMVSETEGFIAQGDDFNCSPPGSVDSSTDPVVLLQDIGFQSNTWSVFGCDLTIGTNITTNNITIDGVIINWDPDYIQWNSTYTTVRSLSPVWGPEVNEYSSMYTEVCANSAGWSSTYTSVNTNSAIWQSAYVTVCSISADLQSNDYFNFFPKIGIEKQGTTPSGGYIEFNYDSGLKITAVANDEIFIGGYIAPIFENIEFDLQPDTTNYIYALLANESSWPSNDNVPYVQTYTSTDDLPTIFRRVKLAEAVTDGSSVISLSAVVNDTTRLFASGADSLGDLHRHYKTADVTFTDRISTSLTLTNSSFLEVSVDGNVKYIPLFDFS